MGSRLYLLSVGVGDTSLFLDDEGRVPVLPVPVCDPLHDRLGDIQNNVLALEREEDTRFLRNDWCGSGFALRYDFLVFELVRNR